MTLSIFLIAFVSHLSMRVVRDSSENDSEVACAIVTAASVVPLPHIIRRYKYTLTELSNPCLLSTSDAADDPLRVDIGVARVK